MTEYILTTVAGRTIAILIWALLFGWIARFRYKDYNIQSRVRMIVVLVFVAIMIVGASGPSADFDRLTYTASGALALCVFALLKWRHNKGATSRR